MLRHPSFPLHSHDGCRTCLPFRRAAARRHRETLRRIRLVAASLPPSRVVGVFAEPRKQETPEVGASEASTAHTVCIREVRAASAQSDTTG
jgi:hypothetical protein